MILRRGVAPEPRGVPSSLPPGMTLAHVASTVAVCRQDLHGFRPSTRVTSFDARCDDLYAQSRGADDDIQKLYAKGSAIVGRIAEIVEDPIVGQVYEGKVVKLMDFGAFVNFYGKRDGLVHVSQISEERVNHPKDVLTEGQNVKVKLMGIDDRGKSKLSMKVLDQSTGKDVEKET